jgi:molybdenum cofactor sulfurtransferase
VEHDDLDALLAGTALLDDLRARDFDRLDRGGHVYLDHTGAGLHPQSLVDAHAELLRGEVFGNPHSVNPTSRPMTELVESARAAVLRHARADPAEYTCVFPADASAALKLVGEAFPFAEDRPLVMSADNHNSVNGIREFATRSGAPVTYVGLRAPDLRLDVDGFERALDPGHPGLVAFPAPSNYSGVQHPWELADRARAAGWRVLVDAAAYAPTNELHLSDRRPDFVSLSFYKMFGYPTGVGALLARHDALAELRRPWFAGGTIAVASVVARGHRLVPGHDGFEDGTLNFLSLPAVEAGLDYLAEVGMEAVHERVLALTGWLLGRMTALRHRSGAPLVRILGPTDTVDRGGTIAFVLTDPVGSELHDRRVEQLAAAAGISLRTGCFCNPGAGETARSVTAADLAPYLRDGATASLCEVDDAVRAARGTGVSALRISVGLSSNAADARAVIDFLSTLVDRRADELGPPPPPPPPGADTA